MERSSLKDHIHHIICGDEAKVRKPNTAVLGSLLEEWALMPEEVVVIGDQHVDAQFALNLGCRGVIVERPGHEFATHYLQDQN